MSDSIPSTQPDPPLPMSSLTPPELPAPEEASPAKKPGKKPRAKRTPKLDSIASKLMVLSPERKGMTVAELKNAVARGTDNQGTSIKLSLRSLVRDRRDRSQSSAVASKRTTPGSTEPPGEKKPAKSSKSMSTKKTTGKKGQGSEKTKGGGAKGKPSGKVPANVPRAEKPKVGKPRLPQQKATPGQVTPKK